jgi:abortive infection bacteriophage resistance protein
MNSMKMIDDQISSILISTIEKLENQLKVHVSYKFGDEITEFSYSEI